MPKMCIRDSRTLAEIIADGRYFDRQVAGGVPRGGEEVVICLLYTSPISPLALSYLDACGLRNGLV